MLKTHTQKISTNMKINAWTVNKRTNARTTMNPTIRSETRCSGRVSTTSAINDTGHVVLTAKVSWVILWQLFKIPSFVYMIGKFVPHVSLATVSLINYSWDRIKCFASCFIKNIYFLRLLLQWGVNICLYRHNILNALFLTFSST